MLVSAFAGYEHVMALYRHAIDAALPLLQLRRRDAAARATTNRPHAALRTARQTDGHARRGRLTLEPRRGRDADLHAGRHLRHRQGRAAAHRSRRWARRSSSATPSTCGCGPGLDVMQPVRRPAPLRGLEQADPHRLAAASRSGRWARCARSARKACSFASPVNGDKLFLTPEVSMQIQTRAEQRHRHAVRRVHAVRHRRPASPPRREARASMELSLRWARRCQDRVRAAGEPQRAVRHRAGRHVRAPARGVARRAGRAWTSPATRSAASASASRRTRCCASWRTRRTGCRRTSRAT